MCTGRGGVYSVCSKCHEMQKQMKYPMRLGLVSVTHHNTKTKILICGLADTEILQYSVRMKSEIAILLGTK